MSSWEYDHYDCLQHKTKYTEYMILGVGGGGGGGGGVIYRSFFNLLQEDWWYISSIYV